MGEQDKPISYITSYLAMGESPTVKRLLKARGTMAERGDIVKPIIDIKVPPQMGFMDKAVEQIIIGITAKTLAAPQDARVRKSKYSVSID